MPQTPTLTVRIKRGAERAFKKAAKEAFPREEFALLLGRRGQDADFWSVEVEKVYFPEGRQAHCSSGSVYTQDSWYVKAKKAAAADGLELVGDIHSHTWRKDHVVKGHSCAPSEDDVDHSGLILPFTEGRIAIFGICSVLETKRGLQAKLRFYPAVPRTDLKVVD